MGVDVQRLLNTRIATELGLGLVGRMPSSVGYRLANYAADRLSAQSDQPIIQGLRSNLWVACGENVTSLELDDIVRRTMRHRAKALFDFYHALGDDSKMMAMVNYGSRFPELLKKNQNKEHGAVVVLVHMGNPELLAIAGPLKGLRGMALTFPGEIGGYQLLNEVRERVGIQAMPSTIASLKMATRYLKDKGTVFTGLERPLPESGYRPMFFGRPTPLPVHHVMLALKADVPIIVFAGMQSLDGRYDMLISELIYMERHSDRKTELTSNTERLLAIAEDFIRRAPEQWSMVHPLWPESSEKIQ